MTPTVQQTLSILRLAGVRLQDSRGTKRAQKAGLHVTRWLGDELRGHAVILPGTAGTYNFDDMRKWYDAAVAALRLAGYVVSEPNGPDAMCCVVS